MKYEFKLIVPSRAFASDILQLLQERKNIGNFRVMKPQVVKTTDIYFDQPDPAGHGYLLAGRGVCCRQRLRGRQRVFQVKQATERPREYPLYETHEFPVAGSRSSTDVPPDVQALLERVLAPTVSLALAPIGVIRNERSTVKLTAAFPPGASVDMHLDQFEGKDEAGGSLGQGHEIEVVSEDSRLVMDVVEILQTSFRLVRVQRSKIQRLGRGIWSHFERPKLGLDVDTGVDDAMALMLALRSPEKCEVVGVSAVGGNVPLAQVLENTAKILHFSGVKPAPPLFRGTAMPGARGDASDVHGADGMGDISSFLHGFRAFEPGDLLSGFVRMLDQNAPGEVCLVATGPLTNVALLARECPDSLRRIKRIVIMGGAFSEPGNREAAPEFNIYSDPDAAVEVLDFCRRNGLVHTFVPLDVTHRVVLTRKMVADRVASGATDAAFVASLTQPYMDFHERDQAMNGCPLHDAVAVAALLWPEFFTVDQFRVEIGGARCGPFAGATVADFRPTRILRSREDEVTEIVLQVDRERCLAQIVARLVP